MKYIRTKDEIFDETEHRHTIKNGKVSIMGIFYEFKQADTIEKLCDEFVVIITNWKEWHEQYISLDEALDFLKEYDYEINKNAEIYGAIWTDKGLIYVAKMNENGELELL